IDGLRADAIEAANAPTLKRLIREGAATVKAQTVLPSNTLPAHTSMMTGIVPARHGILWNDDTSNQTAPLEVPTVFDLASEAGFVSAMYVGKSKLSELVHPEAPTRTSIPQINEIWLADKVSAQVL